MLALIGDALGAFIGVLILFAMMDKLLAIIVWGGSAALMFFVFYQVGRLLSFW